MRFSHSESMADLAVQRYNEGDREIMATYNGWSNYETWAVKLWMDNEEGSQSYWAERATGYRHNRSLLADVLKDEHEEATPELGASVFSDLLNAALGSVDWDEIAEALISDLEDEDEDEAS